MALYVLQRMRIGAEPGDLEFCQSRVKLEHCSPVVAAAAERGGGIPVEFVGSLQHSIQEEEPGKLLPLLLSSLEFGENCLGTCHHLPSDEEAEVWCTLWVAGG